MTTPVIQTVLVDDEPLALRGLELRLKSHLDVEIIAECANGREAVRVIREVKPDLVFLDIQMPGLGGFDVLKALIGQPLPMIIFVTAFDRFALDAFDAHALDYLLKPVDEARLAEAVTRAREEITQRIAIERNARLIEMIRKIDSAAVNLAELEAPAALAPPYEKRITIRDRGQITLLDVEAIDWIDAAGDYMCIQAQGKNHILRETMKRLEKRLDPKKFGRIHRSTIVNLDKVTGLTALKSGDYVVKLQCGGEFRVGRAFKESLVRFI